MKTTRALAYSPIPPTLVTAAGFAASAQYGTWAVATEFAMGVAAGAISFASFRNKLSVPLSWLSGGASLALAQATVTGAAGFDWPTMYAWLFNTIVGAVGSLMYEHTIRHDRSKVRMDEVKIDTMLVRQQIAMLKLQKDIAGMQPEQLPNLTGRTTEETNIRTAVFDLFKAELPGVFVERSRTGWTAVLDLPAGLDRGKLRKEWARVAGALKVDGEFVLTDGPLSSQLVARYLDGDTLAETVRYQRTDAADFRDRVVVGVDRFGDEVSVDLAYYHVLIAGASKFGKSNLMKLLALRLAALPDTVLYGVDMKPGAPEFSLLRPILHDLAETVDQARALFVWLQQEMQERGDIMAKDQSSTWDPAKHGRPAIFVLVDELGQLVREGDRVPRGERKLSDIMEDLLALARAYGIHLILATQQPSNRVFGGRTDARGNTAIRLSVRTAEPIHGQFVFPGRDWRPEELDMPGKILMFSPEHMKPEPYKAQFVSDLEVRQEVERLARELVPAPVGKRLVLPGPDGLSGQQKAMYALKRYGNMTRKELEQATGLDDKQVLRALQALKPEVERDDDAGTWRIAVTGDWEAQAVVSLSK